MDAISFLLTDSKVEDYLTTTILINGLDLKEILGQIEYKQLKGKSNDYVAGAYEGISPFIAFHTHNHFLKNTINEYRYYDDRFSLLEYINSGIPGDHSVACRIEILKDTVVWKNFKNYSAVIKEIFDYEDLTFTFNRKQYENAIQNIIIEDINRLYV